jgi:hypothetical protein
MHPDILVEARPVVGWGNLHVGLQVGVMTAENAVVGFAKSFFLIFSREE